MRLHSDSFFFSNKVSTSVDIDGLRIKNRFDFNLCLMHLQPTLLRHSFAISHLGLETSIGKQSIKIYINVPKNLAYNSVVLIQRENLEN